MDKCKAVLASLAPPKVVQFANGNVAPPSPTAETQLPQFHLNNNFLTSGVLAKPYFSSALVEGIN